MSRSSQLGQKLLESIGLDSGSGYRRMLISRNFLNIVKLYWLEKVVMDGNLLDHIGQTFEVQQKLIKNPINALLIRFQSKKCMI